ARKIRGFAGPIAKCTSETVHANGAVAERLQKSSEGIFAKAALGAGEHILALMAPHLPQYLHGARRQRDAMLAAALSTPPRDGPHVVVKIDLGPFCAAYLAGSCGRQHQEFESARGDTVNGRKAAHECRHLAPRHGRQVLDATLAGSCQQMLKVALP